MWLLNTFQMGRGSAAHHHHAGDHCPRSPRVTSYKSRGQGRRCAKNLQTRSGLLKLFGLKVLWLQIWMRGAASFALHSHHEQFSTTVLSSHPWTSHLFPVCSALCRLFPCRWAECESWASHASPKHLEFKNLGSFTRGGWSCLFPAMGGWPLKWTLPLHMLSQGMDTWLSFQAFQFEMFTLQMAAGLNMVVLIFTQHCCTPQWAELSFMPMSTSELGANPF